MQGWMPVADEFAIPNLGYVFVNAPTEYFGGFSWFPIPGITDPYADESDMHAGINESRAKLQEFIAHIQQEVAVSTKQLFLMGFSQGCVMSLDTALRYDDCFAGIVAISGYVGIPKDFPDAFGTAALQQDILMTHGRYDDVIPRERTFPQQQALQELGVNLRWEEYDKAHSLDPQREIPQIRGWIMERMTGAE